MSNRRKPKKRSSIEMALPLPLTRVPWSDDPPAWYPQKTLAWIVSKIPQRMALNVWICEQCSEGVLCYDLHPGVTPFTVSHWSLTGGKSKCNGVGLSAFYNGAVIREYKMIGPPTAEWYRPSAIELRGEARPVVDHVMQGGLLVRPVTPAVAHASNL